MTSVAGSLRLVLLVGVAWALIGCLPVAQNQSEEELEAHFQAGKSRVKTLDFKGAVECFERALEVNPQNASAHFELGWLYDQKDPDPAAAIYHYNRYLRLRPKAGNAEMVRARVTACKQELASMVSLSPVTVTLQKEVQQSAEQIRRLKEELQSWQAYALRLQALTNFPASPQGISSPVSMLPFPTRERALAATNGPTANPAARPPAQVRHHTVRAGENPTTIAKQYGIKVDALLSANPRLDTRRMKVGQTLVIPAR